MDDIDRHLLALLRTNARTPVATLAKELNVARGTVQNRMSKLERAGVIAGYSVRLRPQVDEQRITALMRNNGLSSHGRPSVAAALPAPRAQAPRPVGRASATAGRIAARDYIDPLPAYLAWLTRLASRPEP